MPYTYGTKLAGGARSPLTGAPSVGPTLPTVFLGGLPQLYGEEVFTTAGEYTWTVPRNVHSVSVVCVGGGNGSSTSGTSHFNNSLYAFGSAATVGGGFQGADGGGVGGTGGAGASDTNANGILIRAGGGGGGAGGYCGNGGNGGNGNTNPTATNNNSSSGGGGGGVGLFGLGSSGLQGTTSGSPTNGLGGAGGGGGGAIVLSSLSSGGRSGQGGSGGTPSTDNVQTPAGGVYGGGEADTTAADGGGGLGWKNNIRVNPGQQIPLKVGTGGAVRIIWGTGRTFPVNAQ